MKISMAGELGLSTAGGLSVLVANNAAYVARRARLRLDESDDIGVVEGDG